MFSKTILAVAMTGLTAAAPAARDTAHYELQAVHSGNLDVHLKFINFNNNTWVIGEDATTSCLAVDCSGYATNVSVINEPGSQLGLYTTGTGFQYAYAAVNTGTVGNTLAHSDGVYPNGVYSGPWSQSEGQLKFEDKDFYACPFDADTAPGSTPYRMTAQEVGVPSIGQRCIDIGISLVPYTGPGAFQYNQAFGVLIW